ncbi:CTD small phosphatase-like protein 3 isoform X2 [Impatiens glandulifera]|uniref:CTD small phosphatase-like protein 3 isoform X2 n=1 Tax=Impatiens glandulifera TaxID=253017 RepID=UPI001FB18870|nr:CTD small phosphatase-like protein 3 isoform X2 [Impatiens glandulifera]
MQTRKKNAPKVSARDPVSPRVTRHQKKPSENGKLAEKKVTDLITSSARKPKNGGILSKKSGDHTPATNLATLYGSPDGDNNINMMCVGQNTTNVAVAERDSNGGSSAECITETIFSPVYHVTNNLHGQFSNGVDFLQFFHNVDGECIKENSDLHMMNGVPEENITKHNDALMATTHGANMSSEVSTIYLSMQDSRLECIDEHDQDYLPNDASVENDENEEYDDFDPFLFIKNLPDLSLVVPTFRPMLLPKQTRSCPSTTLVLDLDETLVHSTLEPCEGADFTFPVNFNLKEHTIYVRCRPHLKDFMERVGSLFEIIIFTASQSIYAEQLLNILDPKRRIIRHRVYRDSCVFVDGNYLKDLSVLGRDLSKVIIVDNSPQAFGFQVDNGIPIESWFDDGSDQELLLLLPFLESLVGVEDVRPLIGKKYNLRERIAAAVCPSKSNGGYPFER